MSRSLKVYLLVLNAEVVLLRSYLHLDFLMLQHVVDSVRRYSNKLEVVGHVIADPVICGREQTVSRGADLIVDALIFR